MKDYLKVIISKAIASFDYDGEIQIEKTKDDAHGDYASNIAMQLSKTKKTNPRLLAEEIIAQIKDEAIDKVEIAGPGFINFFINKEVFQSNLNQVLKQGSKYGSSDLAHGQKFLIEYVSANPTGYLHVGHARGACYGDNVARLKAFTGYQVIREYYINDAGNQMLNLGKSIKARYYELCGLEATIPENGYAGKEIIAIASQIKTEYGDKQLEASDEYFKDYGLKILLAEIKTLLANFNVTFDEWTSEQWLYDSGRLNTIIDRLKQTGNTYQEDGATWLKTTKYGDDKDRVLIKKDGTYTYFLPDIAEHDYKYERCQDEIVDVLGADHHGYINRMKAAMTILGHDASALKIDILQMVRMIQDGQEVKMSKRTGNAYTIKDLIKEVGTNATRYFFAAKSLDTQMDFDISLATKKSNDNPVYYICYAYARIHSILKESKVKVGVLDHYTTLDSLYDKELLTKMYEFNDLVKSASLSRQPHLIANYAYELANAFHVFYAKERVLKDDLTYTQEHLNLISAVGITLNNALSLIGVEPPEEM